MRYDDDGHLSRQEQGETRGQGQARSAAAAKFLLSLNYAPRRAIRGQSPGAAALMPPVGGVCFFRREEIGSSRPPSVVRSFLQILCLAAAVASNDLLVSQLHGKMRHPSVHASLFGVERRSLVASVYLARSPRTPCRGCAKQRGGTMWLLLGPRNSIVPSTRTCFRRVVNTAVCVEYAGG